MYLAHLLAFDGGFWVADLRLEVPVEKGWLAGQQRKPGYLDEIGAEKFGQRLVRIRERPAVRLAVLAGVCTASIAGQRSSSALKLSAR
jgi:hypothetical protein